MPGDSRNIIVVTTPTTASVTQPSPEFIIGSANPMHRRLKHCLTHGAMAICVLAPMAKDLFPEVQVIEVQGGVSAKVVFPIFPANI